MSWNLIAGFLALTALGIIVLHDLWETMT